MADDVIEAAPPAPAVLLGDGRVFTTGWVKDPQESRRVAAAMGALSLSAAAPQLMSDPRAAGDAPVFFWESEKKVMGRVMPSWDQGQVGSCVGFGYGRGCNDLMLNEIASGQPERYPGADVAPEVIYGGSRVEVGGGRINGDGSIGAWAAKWVKDWGVVVRGVYGNLDISRYVESTCRVLGRNGIPADVESLARQHPVTDVAVVATADELWAALGAGKPVPVCSGQGFTTTRDADGYCRRSGSWAHCMLYRGRFVHPRRGRSVIEQNSWGGYLGGPSTFQYVAEDGTTKTAELPEGCFCVELDVAAQALREDDTFALAGLTGWEATPPPEPTPPVPPVPPGPTPPVPGADVRLVLTILGVPVPGVAMIGSAVPFAAGQAAADLGLADWVRIVRAVVAFLPPFIRAVNARDWPTALSLVEKLLKDLGVTLTAEEFVAAFREARGD